MRMKEKCTKCMFGQQVIDSDGAHPWCEWYKKNILFGDVNKPLKDVDECTDFKLAKPVVEEETIETPAEEPSNT